ncbi:MAG: hypothetical protein SPF41_03730 [Candidatus Merdousia sp.]|nr:hypothetical protein [Candidatus Merdousia sp.]
MDEKLFHAHKDSHNPNNPYPEFVRQAAKRTKVPIELLTRKKYRGKSADGKCDKHHILDKSLFPKKGTPTISVSKDKHFELQCLLAQATTLQGCMDYEQAMKTECPEIQDLIAQIYWQRIESLHTPWRIRLAVLAKKI